MKQLAISLSAMKHALSGWLCGSGLQAAIGFIAAWRPLPPKLYFRHSDEACGALFIGIFQIEVIPGFKLLRG